MGEEVDEFRTCSTAEILQIGSDIVDNGEECWVYGVQLIFARQYKRVNGLFKISKFEGYMLEKYAHRNNEIGIRAMKVWNSYTRG